VVPKCLHKRTGQHTNWVSQECKVLVKIWLVQKNNWDHVLLGTKNKQRGLTLDEVLG